jgi:hypothetical protein
MTEPLPTHDEAVRMLAVKAREGSVTAIVHLERYLRTQHAEQNEVDDAIDAILARAESNPGGGRD